MAYVLLFVIAKSLLTCTVIVSNLSPVVLLLPTELEIDLKARIWTDPSDFDKRDGGKVKTCISAGEATAQMTVLRLRVKTSAACVRMKCILVKSVVSSLNEKTCRERIPSTSEIKRDRIEKETNQDKT
jgi:hypothetical protein